MPIGPISIIPQKVKFWLNCTSLI